MPYVRTKTPFIALGEQQKQQQKPFPRRAPRVTPRPSAPKKRPDEDGGGGKDIKFPVFVSTAWVL